MTKLSSVALILVLAAAVAVTSCRRGDPVVAGSLREIEAPVELGSGQPNLAVGPGGEVYLSWMETTEEGTPVLRFAVRRGEQWSPVQTIAQANDLLINWADFPSLLPLEGGLLAAHWMTTLPGDEGYGVNVAFSRDGGATWTKPVVPHRDNTPTEHGFVSLVAAPRGGLGVIWLDSRKLTAGEGSGDVAMMYTEVTPEGQLGEEKAVDGRVCECCQPMGIRAGNGILAVYRDRSAEEIRDIAVVRFDGSQWLEPKTVFADNWEIYACPINGPAIAADGDFVAVAWFTAAGDQLKVQVAFSTDGGETFGAPVRVDDGDPMGRVDVAAVGGGAAVVSWIERVGEDGQVRARAVRQDGTAYPSFLVGQTSIGFGAGFPRLERSGSSVTFAWTDPREGQVRVATADLRN